MIFNGVNRHKIQLWNMHISRRCTLTSLGINYARKFMLSYQLHLISVIIYISFDYLLFRWDVVHIQHSLNIKHTHTENVYRFTFSIWMGQTQVMPSIATNLVQLSLFHWWTFSAAERLYAHTKHILTYSKLEKNEANTIAHLQLLRYACAFAHICNICMPLHAMTLSSSSS